MSDYGIDRITPSGLMLYEMCPKAFYYSVWLGLKLPQPMVHLRFGTAYHLAIGEIYDQMKDGGWPTPNLEKAKQAFLNSFTPDAIDNGPDKFNIYQTMTQDALLMIEEFWSKKEFFIAEGICPTDTELVIKMTPFNPETKEPLPLKMSLRLDFLCSDNKILELKTSGQPYDIFETRASLQAKSYAWVRYCQTGIIPTVDYIVAIKKRKKEKIQHLRIKYDMADILSHDANVRMILEKIKNREFEKPKHGHMPYCDCKKFEAALNVKY